VSPGRPIIAAAQVAVVGVLIAVVYTNLLRPGDESAFSGVDAPAGPEVTQSAEPCDDGSQGADDDAATSRAAQSQSVATSTGVGPIAGSTPSSLGPAGGTPGSPGTAPTDDQYLDAVARLTVKLY
jgi:hypothetical protein